MLVLYWNLPIQMLSNLNMCPFLFLNFEDHPIRSEYKKKTYLVHIVRKKLDRILCWAALQEQESLYKLN